MAGTSTSPSVEATTSVSTVTSPSSTKSTTSMTSAAGATVPITTTFSSSSQQCVATLQAQVLDSGATAVMLSQGKFVTLNETCHTTTATRNNTVSLSSFPSYSSGAVASSSSAGYANLNSSSNQSNNNNSSSASPGTIAGIAIGVVAVVACLAGLIFWLWLRRRRNNTTVFTAKAKMLEEDRSDQVPIRWEKDGPEIKESDCAEIKEMSAGPLPVEMGDGRSIRETDTTPLSPISIDTSDDRDTLYGESEDIDDIVSPLSPNR